MAFGIDDILGAGLKIFEKIIPDPKAKAEAELELFKMKQAGDFKELEAQLEVIRNQAEINKIEAANTNMFIAGWRPAAGWVCVIGLGYQFIARPLLVGLGGFAALPTIDEVLMELLFGMLGLGAFRTAEKFKGVAR